MTDIDRNGASGNGHGPHGAEAEALARHWRDAPRWRGIERPYAAEEVVRLRGSIHVEHTLARLGAERLWELLDERDYVHALGAMTGGQAVQMVRAGLEAIYLSGWQVAAASVRSNWDVGTSTLPPRWPHFFSEASWSS